MFWFPISLAVLHTTLLSSVVNLSFVHKDVNRLNISFSFFPAAVTQTDINTHIRLYIYKRCMDIHHLSNNVTGAYVELNISIVLNHKCTQSGWEGCINVWMSGRVAMHLCISVCTPAGLRALTCTQSPWPTSGSLFRETLATFWHWLGTGHSHP